MRKLATLILLPLFVMTFFAMAVFAQDGAEVTSSTELVLFATSIPEVKLEFIHSYKIPFLQGESPLTEGNNINLSLSADATPVSINAFVKAVWTPIAFIELSAGGRAGSGWPINLLGGDIYGIGLNLPGEDGEAVNDGSALDGLLWKAHLGGTFQFDLAAIFPGDWNSIVFLTYHEINYHGYTRAKACQTWHFEGDEGENMNGFNYYGNFVLGYQMPIFLNLVAFMTEMDLHLYDTANRSAWGDDLIRWTFSCILSFEITEQLGIAVITQLRTRRNFTNFDEKNDSLDSMYFQLRQLDTSNPLRLEFYRVAVALTYKF